MSGNNKTSRPKMPGTCVHIRITPELRQKIDHIYAAEKPKIGTLSLNALLSYLLERGLEKYFENEKK